MTEFTITIRGLDEIRDRIDDFDMLRIAERPIGRSLLRVVGRMADYPAPPAGSTYKRTGTLGRRWTQRRPQIKRNGQFIEGKVGNNTEYGPWVQSQAFQANMHRGRWTTDEVEMQRELPELQRELDQAVERALRG